MQQPSITARVSSTVLSVPHAPKGLESSKNIAHPSPHAKQSNTSNIVVVDDRVRMDFQVAQVKQDISNFLEDVEDAEGEKCRILVSLCNDSYGLDSLDDGFLRRKYGYRMVTSSKEYSYMDYDADIAPSLLMYQGDGITPSYDSIHLTRFAHEMPEDEDPLKAVTAVVEVARNEQPVNEPIPEWHVQVLDTLESAAQMSSQTMAQIAAGIVQPFRPPGASSQHESEIPNSQSLTGDACQGWFVCDSGDQQTRYFVIQGSVSFDSWLVNLSFDPVVLLDPRLGVKVHRGVYQLAEALYYRFLPLIKDHLGSKPGGKISFTGHSLGGSVAQVLLLMYVFHGVLTSQDIDGVFAFGNAGIFCEGACGDCTCADRHTCAAHIHSDAATSNLTLLERLGLPRSTFRNVCMDRDLVPRAFSCNYRPVQGIMHTWGEAWKAHGCLSHPSRPTMYNFLGDVYILSPHVGQAHVKEGYLPALPQRPGLWKVVGGAAGEAASKEQRRWALSVLMDNPHPLEILRTPGSYGDDGAVSRFHNPRNYARSLSSVRRFRNGLLPDTSVSSISLDEDTSSRSSLSKESGKGDVAVALFR